MGFNGTARFAKQEIVDYLESIGSSFGPDLNAQTGFDDTMYWLEIPTGDPEVAETAFQILSDWAYAVTLEPVEVELERDVVLEEWRIRQGFDSRLQDNLLPQLFGSSRYADRNPIGLTEIIETAPVERLRDFYERWYRPDLMAVGAVGDFDTELIETKVKQHFAPPPEGEASQERAAVAPLTDRPLFDIPGHDTTRIEVFTDPESPGTQFILIRKLPPDIGQDLAAFRRTAVERLALMMLNARLFERGQVADPPYLVAGAGRSSFVEPLDILTFSARVEEDPYADVLDDVPLLATLPTPGSITGEERIESIDALRWTLSNGITVIAKQTDFRNDEVVFTALSPGGHSLVADEDHVSALYAAELVSGSGVGPHDNVTLDKLLAGKRVSVSPYIGELFEGFEGNASPEDLETLFQLITLYTTAPRLDPIYFSRYESSLRSIAETRAAQPDAILFDTVNTVLGQNHFRQRPLTIELLEELSLERAEAVYADRFADLGDTTFVFVGAFDWENLRSLTATYLASLPNTGRAEQWRDVEIDPPMELEDHVVHTGLEPRSRTVLVFAGDMEWSREEALTLTVAGEMLGIRLRERVREELGGTYSISVNADDSSLPDPEYLVSIIFGSDPSRAEELLDEVMEEVDWLRTGGEQKYLDTVKELLRTSREEQLRDNGFWLNQIQSAVQRGESFTQIVGFDELLEALTLEQVAAAAQRYLTGDRYVRVVLLPEEG